MDKQIKDMLRKIKPYYDESKNELRKDAPDDVKRMYEKFLKIFDEMKKRGIPKDPPNFN